MLEKGAGWLLPLGGCVPSGLRKLPFGMILSTGNPEMPKNPQKKTHANSKHTHLTSLSPRKWSGEKMQNAKTIPQINI